jgi:aryl-alcohol dehydrogenase-like predicted oxidoreductase
MEYRELGRTGLKVSRLGFGGAPLGLQGYLGWEDKSSDAFERQGARAVAAALERGVTFFDTAPGYGDGRSEEIMGRALAGHRDDIVLATKFHGWQQPDAAALDRLFEGSLRRLRTDHVDLLQVHGGYYTGSDERALLQDGALEWARRQVERGRARFIGLTAETTSGALERLIETGAFDTLQIAYNFVYECHCDYQRAPKGIIPFARERGLGILTMRTATSGFMQRVLKAEFPQLSADALTALAIRFVLSTPEVDCALVGMVSQEQVAANAALVEDLSNRLDLPALNDRYSLDMKALD